MYAQVTKQFKMVPPGAVYPRLYTEGERVEGRVAEVAVAEKWAVELTPPAVELTSPVDAATGSAPVLFKAKVLKACEFQGEKYARGATIEGDVAHALVEAKLAEPLPGDPEPKK